MRLLFSKVTFYLFVLTLMAVVGLWMWPTYFSVANNAGIDTYVAEPGLIKETVSVTGKVDTVSVTRLGFSVHGIIQHIYKKEGDFVNKGEVIASVATTSLVAEYNAAYSNVEYFRQRREELIEGAIVEERGRSQSAVALANAERDLIVNTYEQLIKNAKKSLLSNDLKAYPIDSANDDIPPEISGNYVCEAEGKYILQLYASNAPSNYSYVLSGLESGTYSANVDTSDTLANCGLYIKFDNTEVYKSSGWEIPIPNTRSANYVTLQNDYNRLQAEYAAKIKVVEEAVRLAQSENQVVEAVPTATRVRQADAHYSQALSELARVDAIISDHIIKAPFSGVVSKVAMKLGEVASPEHTVTVIDAGDYVIKALVPEIKIVGIDTGQQAEVYFDAAPEELIMGQVTFISPVSKNIGGVSYYETHIELQESPDWIREGLNADIEIVLNVKSAAVSIPQRYIIEENNEKWVLESVAAESVRKRVELGLVGSNDMVEISGIDVGAKLILP